MENGQKPIGNAMLEFLGEIGRRTGNLCQAGPGPYGFGVSNDNQSDIGIMVALEPPPVRENTLFPEEIAGYEVSIQVFGKKDDKTLAAEEVETLARGRDGDTRKIAEAAGILSGNSRHVTREECLEAFDILAGQELGSAEAPGETQQGFGAMAMV